MSAEPERTAEVRRALSRNALLMEALGIIDEDGLAALTMQRLADRFGVRAMSLYYYFRNRDAVIDGVVELVVDLLYDDPEVHLRADDDWQDYLRALASGIRRFAMDHPRAFPVVATRPPELPWIRPPLRSLRWIESFLATFRYHGFDDDATLYAYRAFTSFLLGHLLLETGAMTVSAPAPGDGSFSDSSPGGGGQPHPSSSTPVPGQVSPTRDGPPVDPEESLARLDPGEYPVLTALADRLSDDHSHQEFGDSLAGLLARLARIPGAPSAPQQ